MTVSTDYWYSFSFGVTWPTNSGWSTPSKHIYVLRGVDRQSHTRLMYLVVAMLWTFSCHVFHVHHVTLLSAAITVFIGVSVYCSEVQW